ncbi:hypothetical protein BV22DRAFT_1071469 [Leucogyrophana mollusca]|uniref:Uncharacterized protein n=1 Tax=Leucogyrophana mollusca TaxID=85980 RepID=A0ACB8B835_9AGAM|nr:hypothetical protein BV22DRAFT_1071469 [Leucogyrophana mollusca]
MSAIDEVSSSTEQKAAPQAYNDCITCRIVGSGAFAAMGVYALRMSRASAPGSVMGKRIMGGLGIGFLIGSVLRWKM